MTAASTAEADEMAAGRSVDVAGARVTLVAEGGLWWPETATLVVADLHLEKGSAFARRGQLLPPYDTIATLNALGRLVRRFAPARVIALGDSFHDDGGGLRLPDDARATLHGLQRGREWLWIAGNHDPRVEGDVGGDQVREVSIGPLTFRHEPRVGALPGEIAGHLHPAARVPVRGRTLRRRAFVGDGRRLILPAFGAYTGGLNALDRAYLGLFEGRRFEAHLCGDGRVHSFPGRVLLGD